MEKLRAKLLAFPSAEIKVFTNGKKRLQKVFHHQKVEYVDHEPEVLVFLTGGSERIALQSVLENGFYLLLASATDNAWAAATEVKAWMNQNGISSLLVDYNTPKAAALVESYYSIKNGLKRLKGQRFGLVGNPSDWLVNSTIDPFVIKTKLGIEQIDIPWSKVPVDGQTPVAPEFSSFFKEFDPKALMAAGTVFEALAKAVREYRLNAVTAECFSLVGAKGTTACLALSKLSMDGIPAGCEGDTCSLLGLMLVKEFFGVIPWMANTAHVDGNRVLFSHCTVPANLLSSHRLDTHFETGKGVAIAGELRASEVTILRVDHSLSKIFVGKGKVIDSPRRKEFCRTQLLVEVSESASNYFICNPLGNHHIIIPGDCTLGLDLFARILRMQVVL